jgi:hypothetical protein
LIEISKGDHGLVERIEVKLIDKEHVPDREATEAGVSHVSIFHHKGANALAEDPADKSAPGLTIVYGDSRASKTC